MLVSQRSFFTTSSTSSNQEVSQQTFVLQELVRYMTSCYSAKNRLSSSFYTYKWGNRWFKSLHREFINKSRSTKKTSMVSSIPSDAILGTRSTEPSLNPTYLWWQNPLNPVRQQWLSVLLWTNTSITVTKHRILYQQSPVTLSKITEYIWTRHFTRGLPCELFGGIHLLLSPFYCQPEPATQNRWRASASAHARRNLRHPSDLRDKWQASLEAHISQWLQRRMILRMRPSNNRLKRRVVMKR